MIKKLRISVLLLLAMAMSGCARMAFYSNADLSGKETGIKFYTAKPYLLVARTGSKDKPVDVSLIYMPDLANPLYAKPKSGLGSAKLSIAMSNGMLTSFGQETDPKIGDLLGAIGGLQKDLATAKKTAKEASLLDQAGVDYSQVAASLTVVANDLDRIFGDARNKALFTTNEHLVGNSIAASIRAASGLLADPLKAGANAPAAMLVLKGAMDNWDKQIGKASNTTSGPELLVRRNIDVLKDQAKAQLSVLTPKDPDQPTFTLYEVINANGFTALREVTF